MERVSLSRNVMVSTKHRPHRVEGARSKGLGIGHKGKVRKEIINRNVREIEGIRDKSDNIEQPKINRPP